MAELGIWQLVNGEAHIKPLSMKLYRVVESQEQVATTLITDSQEEQLLLEELLEDSKPVQESSLAERHYLIKTPFRYPPLKYGSRFGTVWEPALFYGSQTVECALAEVAYYRFVFLSHTADSAKLTKHHIQSYHSSFYVNTQSDKAIQLNQLPFIEHDEALTSVDSYQHTQQLGKAMRDSEVEMFSFKSARLDNGLNGAVYHHQAIKSAKPNRLESWQCLTQEERVVFHNPISATSFEFSKSEYLKDGSFPLIG